MNNWVKETWEIWVELGTNVWNVNCVGSSEESSRCLKEVMVSTSFEIYELPHSKIQKSSVR